MMRSDQLIYQQLWYSEG